MKPKVCSKCNLLKNLSDFYQRKKYRAGEYYEKCKDCMKLRGRSYYYKNQSRQKELALIRKQKYIEKRRNYIDQFKGSKACMDCGRIYPPWIMDFDHREGEIKIASISWMALRGISNFEKIKKEITKCDVVCSNCHRQRTHDRLQKVKEATVAKMVKAGA